MLIRHRTIKIGVILSTIALTIGCAAISRRLVQKPKVELDHVRVSNVSTTGATVFVGVSVENPNSFSLKVDSVSYSLEIAGKELSQGKIDQPTEVKGKATRVIEIPVPVRYRDLFASIVDLIQAKKSQYRVKGEAIVGHMTLPFDEKGELKMGD